MDDAIVFWGFCFGWIYEYEERNSIVDCFLMISFITWLIDTFIDKSGLERLLGNAKKKLCLENRHLYSS